jgi:hypothetical protein
VTPGALLEKFVTLSLDGLFRLVASVFGVAACVVLISDRWASPLRAIAALPLPQSSVASDWLSSLNQADEYVAEHASAFIFAGGILLIYGLIACSLEPTTVLPRSGRGASSAVFGFALLVQVGQASQALTTLLVVSFVWSWARSRKDGPDFPEVLGAIFLHTSIALIWLPGMVISWFFGRRPEGTPEVP